MTKNTFLLATSLSMMMLGTQASAASTVDLTVDGSITPAACTPTLSGGGVVDYGDIHASTMASGVTHIGIKTLTLTISCAAPTLVGISAQDNKVGTSVGYTTFKNPLGNTIGPFAPNSTFGFGTSNGKNIGAYMIFTGLDYADGGTPYTLISSSDGSPWVESGLGYGGGAPRSDGTKVHSFAQPSTLIPTPISSVTGSISISASINTRDGLTFQDEVNMDGSATLSLVYL